jgi:PAS domain-containing protein/DNA-binding CsgD family transcriptional regulator
VYHREHDVPAASSRPAALDDPGREVTVTVSPSPGLDSALAVSGARDALLDQVAAAPRLVHACLSAEIVDADHGFVLLLNADHVCVHASEGIRSSFGCEPSSLIGTRPEANLEPDQLPAVWRSRAAISAGARHVLTRVRWRAAGGGPERWFDATSSMVRDPGNGDRYTVVHGREVTHELELQAALTRSEQRHAGLLDSIDQAVLQLDVALRVASFNGQALSLLGRAPDELLGRSGFAVLDLRDEAGRVVTDPTHPALIPGSVTGRDDTWCTVAAPDGQRLLVLARLRSYSAARPADAGHLLILRQARGNLASAPIMPSRDQARAAASLTAREGDVLDGLAAGGDVPTIARWLGISVHSVRGHVKSITAKLGVHSQLQAVIAATRRGMVDLTEEHRPPPGH